MNVSRTDVVYWTKTLFNSSSDSIYATIEETFSSPMIQKADSYVLCVERFEIALNGIPYYDSTRGEVITLTNINSGEPTELKLDQDAYTLNELVDYISEQASTNNYQTAKFSIEIDSSGYIGISLDYQDYTLQIPTYLNYVLGMETADTPNENGSTWYSKYPRFDCGDEIDHIRLVSNLDLVSDNLGQAKTNIVTDVANPTSVSGSASSGLNPTYGYTFSQRQKLMYVPYQRRFLNFSSPVPIQILRISCEYVRSDGTSSIIKIPRGGNFSIKLGFYKR